MSSTICVRDLPDNVSRREFRHLVALLPGYEDCSVTGGQGTAKPAVAFAKFRDPGGADHALRTLNGYVFDDDIPQRQLQVEMARRDLEVRPRPPGGRPGPNGPPRKATQLRKMR